MFIGFGVVNIETAAPALDLGVQHDVEGDVREKKKTNHARHGNENKNDKTNK